MVIFCAVFLIWFCFPLYRLDCLENSVSGQGAFTARLDTIERNAANYDEKISDILSRMESFCSDIVSVNNRRAFPSNRGPRGRGQPHIVLSSDRRFESKSREFNVPRKRGSEAFRSSVRDGPSRHYWTNSCCSGLVWSHSFTPLHVILVFRLVNSITCNLIFFWSISLLTHYFSIHYHCLPVSSFMVFIPLLRIVVFSCIACFICYSVGFEASNHLIFCSYIIFAWRTRIVTLINFLFRVSRVIPRYILLRCPYILPFSILPVLTWSDNVYFFLLVDFIEVSWLVSLRSMS